MREWFEERRKWQELAADNDRALAEHESWSRELEEAKDWAQEQAAAWKERAEVAERRLAFHGLSGSEQSALADGQVQPGASNIPPRITVVTEVDGNTAALEVTSASLLAQSFCGWEWAIVTGDETCPSAI